MVAAMMVMLMIMIMIMTVVVVTVKKGVLVVAYHMTRR